MKPGEESRRRRTGAGLIDGLAALAIAPILGGLGCAPATDGAAAAPPSPPTQAGERAPSAESAPDGRMYGFGTAATAADIAAFDIDIGPDGAGLPPGQGSVEEGLAIYEAKCIACHGATGSEGPWDRLAPRLPADEFPFAEDPSARSTVGNYWPYATTLFDYTRRAMPFEFPGSLTDDEVYALVAAMLYMNDLVPADAIMDSAAVTNIVMPARDRFVEDDRAGGPEVR
ncbi:MAG: cytochrome c [Gemmatimonadetes bacterium]|nr:cytochrome c [Gemmatimonadota bacterium]